jgi:hypothetical protein
MKWHLQRIKVSDLKEYDKNPMQHNEKDLGDLEVSIKKFGVADPIRANTMIKFYSSMVTGKQDHL